MARPTLSRNVKFLALVKRLGIPKPYAKGCLETMWESCHETGDPTFKQPEHVELAAEWPGESGRLVKALIAEKFLDEQEDGSLVCHDYWDHCPQYVTRRAEREEARRKKGKDLSQVRAESGRKGAVARQKIKANDRQTGASENHLLTSCQEKQASGEPLASHLPIIKANGKQTSANDSTPYSQLPTPNSLLPTPLSPSAESHLPEAKNEAMKKEVGGSPVPEWEFTGRPPGSFGPQHVEERPSHEDYYESPVRDFPVQIAAEALEWMDWYWKRRYLSVPNRHHDSYKRDVRSIASAMQTFPRGGKLLAEYKLHPNPNHTTDVKVFVILEELGLKNQAPAGGRRPKKDPRDYARQVAKAMDINPEVKS